MVDEHSIVPATTPRSLANVRGNRDSRTPELKAETVPFVRREPLSDAVDLLYQHHGVLPHFQRSE
jgi:hypothetical protein